MSVKDDISTFRDVMISYKRPKSVIILAYHRICDLTGLFYDRNISATPEEFRSQMEYLKANYNVITGDQLVDYFDLKTAIPEKAIMVTFDDGFKDTVSNALPILVEFKLLAMAFLVTDYINSKYVPWEDELALVINRSDLSILSKNISGLVVGHSKEDATLHACIKLRGLGMVERETQLREFYSSSGLDRNAVIAEILASGKGMMDENDIKAWISAGMEVGSHTCSHSQSSKIDSATVEKELRVSKSKLEEITKKEVSIFAYPYGMKGYYDRDTIRLVQEAGYKCAVSLMAGINTLKTNRFDLKRMGIAPYVSFEKACDGCLR